MTEKAKIEIIQAAKAPAAANAADGVIVSDSQGRNYLIKEPEILASLDFKDAIGDKVGPMYLLEVMHLQYVAEIDGEPVNTPKTNIQIRALYKRLGKEGNKLVQAQVGKQFYSEESAATEDAELKNS